MKAKTPLDWNTLFLKEHLRLMKEGGELSEAFYISLDQLLNRQASSLLDEDRSVVHILEKKVRALESDSGIARMGGR